MTKRQVVITVAMVLVVAVAVSGCETSAGSTGTGAGLGGALGAVIGHQSGHALEGAAIGALVGGLTGWVVHREVQARKVREAQQTAEYYEYQPTQGLKVYPEASKVAPEQINQGNIVKATMEYAVLGAPASGITVVEKRVLKKDGNVLAELDSEAVTRTNGTWVSSMDISVGKDVAPGTYEIAQTLETPEGHFSKSNMFTVY